MFQGMAIDVLGDVFRDVARRRAFVGIDFNRLEAMEGGAGFVAIVLQCIPSHAFANCCPVFRWHEQQQMPMRGSIMVRFDHTKAIGLNAAAMEFGTDQGPKVSEIGMGLQGRGAVIAWIGLAVMATGMHPGGRREGVELADMAHQVGDHFKTANPDHQFSPTHGGIGYGAVS
jgi:hypothetical protein